MHRDVKPDNLLCSRDDLSRIKLIDFGISLQFGRGQPSKYDPLKDRKHIVGTLYWASLNSHNGESTRRSQYLSPCIQFTNIHTVDISPRDDTESLAYVALFLLRGTLPWIPRPYTESILRSQEIVRLMKTDYNPSQDGVPEAFAESLIHSRSLPFHQLPDYGALKQSFNTLAEQKGCNLEGPLDWTPCNNIQPAVTTAIKEPDCLISSDDEEDDDEGSEDEIPKNSYFAIDIEMWDPQGDRDKDLTLPSDQEVELDGCIPLIVEVTEDLTVAGGL